MERAPLVTGGTGFAATHLIQLLLEEHETLRAWSRPGGCQPEAGDHRVHWTAVDLLDRDAVTREIARLRPSVIYHCGGAADVGASWTRPAATLRVNALGTHHVLDAVRVSGVDVPVLITGSALVYRPSPDPLDEEAPLAPSSPYAFSKLAQEMLALQADGLRAIVARSFNHAGPRQSDAYVTSSFARQIAEAEVGMRQPVLRVGNLESRRDLTDVRDTVRAYRLLVAHGQPRRPYNVCSGRAYRVGDLLDTLLGLARVPMRVEADPQRMRPSDVPLVLGDGSRIRRETGWTPRLAIERTLADLLDDWRTRIAAGRA